MSTGAGTAVANGTATITAVYNGHTATTTTTVATTSTVTSVTPMYNSANVAKGALLFTGTSYTFSAQDQSGNPLDGTVGAWSSSDPTNAPVNATTGVCTPNAGVCGATLTYTHTASGKTATIPVTVLLGGGTVLDQDAANNYADTTAFYNNVWNTGNITGATGGAGSKYVDGTTCTPLTIDTATGRLFMGQKTWLSTFPGGSASTGGYLITNNPAGVTRAFTWRLERYYPAGEVGPSGTSAQFQMYSTSGTPAWAYKAGPGFGFSGTNGRAQVGYSNGSSSNVYGGPDIYTVDNECLQVSPPIGASGEICVGSAQTDFDGAWQVRIVLVEKRGPNVWSQRQWLAKMGQAPTPVISADAMAEIASVNTITLATNTPFGDNWNTTRDANQLFYRSIWKWQTLDGSASGDPLGVIGAQPTPTLTSTDTASIAHGTSGVTITLTGTNFNRNCYPVFSNSGIRVTPVGGNGVYPNGANLSIVNSTTMQVKIDALSTATVGAGTIAVYNAASKTTTATVAFSVT